MEPWAHLFLILLLIIPPTSTAQFTFRNWWCSSDYWNYQDSTYQSNLNRVLASLSSDTSITYGFYNFTVGETPNRVSFSSLCRGDIPLGTCRAYMRNAVALLSQLCSESTNAFGYHDHCSIFVSNGTYHAQDDNEPGVFGEHESFSDPVAYNRTVYSLLHKLLDQSAAGNAERKFATGEMNISGTGSVLYGLVQCTPDLSRSQCVRCVQQPLDYYLPQCCNKQVSPFMLMKPSCSVRYDTNRFYGNVPDITPLPSPTYTDSARPRPSSVTHRRTNTIIFVVCTIMVGIAALVIGGTIIFILMKRTRGKLNKSWVSFNDDEINTLESLQFSFKEINHATQEFADSNKLGQGGFGTVYKGVLSNGQEIAAKRLGRNSGEEADAQFKNEIVILAKLQHRNLVRLLGYCLHKQEMILVFEFMPNRSLDNFLFDSSQSESMKWETRYKIISGISRGLLYLHEESRLRIIHCDLKAANVLLDSKFNPKIADFGIARLFSIDQTRVVASNIAGTIGYMPPEYMFQGQVSTKLDVYSFGVLILEIISGQRVNKLQTNAGNPEDLLNFAWKCWRNRTTTSSLVDPALSKSDGLTNKDEILRCIHIGLLCVQQNPVERPTMSSVDSMLQSDSRTLPIPSQPALFTDQKNVRSDVGCSVNLVTVSIDEVYPR